MSESASNTDVDVIPGKYDVLPGSVDYGKEYEVNIAALLGLRCLSTEHQVDKMWLATNAKDCGALDDIVLFVQTRDGKKITYLMQLKHQITPTSIKVRDFKSTEKGDFALRKYFETIFMIDKQIAENRTESVIINHLRLYRDDLIFILFTNRRPSSDNDFLHEVITENDKWLLHELIDTNGNIFMCDYEKLSLTLTEDGNKSLGRFFLFTDQIHNANLELEISNTIESLLQPIKLQSDVLKSIVQQYILFVSKWSKGELGGNYTLTKEHIYKIILEHTVAPYLWTYETFECDKTSSKLWDEIIQNESITLIENDEVVTKFLSDYVNSEMKNYCGNRTNKNVWKTNPNLISKDIFRSINKTNIIKPREAYEYLWKTNKIPLILSITNNQQINEVLHVLNLFEFVFHVILLSDKPYKITSKEPLKLFTTLDDLSQEQQLEFFNYSVRLQGRNSVKLVDVIKNNNQLISVKDIIYILTSKFSIGNELASLPDIFIQRSLEGVWLKPEVLLENTEEIFVIKSCSSHLKTFLSKIQLYAEGIQVVDFDFIKKTKKVSMDFGIIRAENKKEVEVIVSRFKHRVLHILILHGLHLEWIESFGTINNIRKFRQNDISNFERVQVDEIKMVPNKTTLISAFPGMGKSVLMDFFARSASINLWVLKIDLFHYADTNKNEDFDSLKHLKQYALNQIKNDELGRKVFKEYLNSNKLLVLFDGFDEVPNRLQKKVSKLIKKVQDSNYYMYVTTRPILKMHLEELLDTFAKAISPFSKTDQLTFLEMHFNAMFTNLKKVKREKITVFTEKLLNAANKNFNDHDEEFTGIPLQTKLLGEVFGKDCKTFIDTEKFECERFDLLYLYKQFIRQKTQIACEKFGNVTQDIIYQYKNDRSLYALCLLFKSEDLKGLRITEKLDDRSLPLLQKDGIVVAEHEKKVNFVHRTFAEYLTAKWLAKNRNNENVRILIITIFEPNFITVRNIFDRILATECPLHLAIINRQSDNIKTMISTSNSDFLMKTDKGQRTFLHLLAAWGVYHPPNTETNKEVDYLYSLVRKDPMMEALKLIQEMISVSKDGLLNYTELDYAILSRSLNIADGICAKMQNTHDSISLNDIQINLIYYQMFLYCSLEFIVHQRTIVSALKDSIEEFKQTAGKLQINTTEIHGHGCNELHKAVVFEHPLLVEELLANGGAESHRKSSDGKIALHWAVILGNLPLTTMLVNSIDINVGDNNGMTCLHYAIIVSTVNQLEIINILLRNGANITMKDNLDNTPVHYALHYNKLEILKMFLNLDVGINNRSSVLSTKDAAGGTVLHWSAVKGLTSTVQFFLSYGVLVDDVDNDGKTALHWAIDKDYEEIVSVLISNGANLNAKDKDDRTPLLLAVLYDSINSIKVLLKAGASVQEKDILGRTPLLHAISRDAKDIIELLLFEGSLEDKDNQNINALQWAAAAGNQELVNLLLSKGLTFKEKNVDGRSALVLAAYRGHVGVVGALLDKGADIDEVDNQGMSALHRAAANNRYLVADLLISAGANVNVQDNERTSVLMYASGRGAKEIVNLLLDKGVDVDATDNRNRNALHFAASTDCIETVELLLAKKLNMEAKDDDGRTPLIYAANNGCLEVVKLLVSKEAALDLQDHEGRTALHEAAGTDEFLVADFLISAGANVNLKDNDGTSALMNAAASGTKDIVNLLLQKEVDVDDRNKDNRTALHIAALNGCTDVVEILLRRNCSVDPKDEFERTPLMYAAARGDVSMVTLLLSNGSDSAVQDGNGLTARNWAENYGHKAATSLLIGHNRNSAK